MSKIRIESKSQHQSPTGADKLVGINMSKIRIESKSQQILMELRFVPRWD